jgi:GAF domain-containing protein
VIIPLGVSLSAEKDFNRLLETIVIEAQKITRAEAGSLYLRTPDNLLRFVILRNHALKIFLGGTTGKAPVFKSIPMYLEAGQPNHHNLASYVALTGKSVALADAYQTTEFDLSGTRAFDAETGYRSQSFITIPLRDTAEQVIGVLQLINAQDEATGKVVPFNQDEVIDSLGLITSAALSAYIREESLRQEITKLRIEIDHAHQNKQVEEITESDYFQQLQAKARKMREQRNQP